MKTISEALGAESDPIMDAISMRYIGMDMNEWAASCRRRLEQDIRSGKLNPCRWFPMDQLSTIAGLYGFADSDDLQIDRIPIEIAERWNRGIGADFQSRHPENTRTLKSIACFRINPNKYHFYIQQSRYPLDIYHRKEWI